MTSYDAIVLAGGRGSRLAGPDKPLVKVGNRRLVDRVLDSVAGARSRILVGPSIGGDRVDVVTREDPEGSGPVAAIAAGLPHVAAPNVAVVAADLPFLTSSLLTDLLAALRPGVDVAVLVDDAGRDQLLVAMWRTAALRAALTRVGNPAGRPARALFDGASVARVHADGAGGPPPWLDCDTEDDLRRAREWA